MIRLPNEVSDLEKLSLIPLSYSRLNTFERCNAQFFYQYIEQLPSVFGPAASLGNVIHEALEHTDFSQPLSLERMQVLFAEAKPKYDPDNLISNKLIEDANVMMGEFTDRHSGDVVDIIGKEVGFCIVVGPALISGYIDRIDRRGQTVVCIDWKSGRVEVSQKDAAHNLQLGIYALALSKMFPENSIRAELYYLRSGRIKWVDYSPQDLIDTEQRIIDAASQLIHTETFGYTDNARICSWCDFSQVCPVGKKRTASQKNYPYYK